MAAPSWKDDAEVVFTKHIALRSGSDYTVLDKILTQRADDDATAPNGILSPSAGTFTLTDTRQGDAVISPSDAEWPDHNENSIHGDSWTFHDGSAKGATRTDGRDEATRIADAMLLKIQGQNQRHLIQAICLQLTGVVELELQTHLGKSLKNKVMVQQKELSTGDMQTTI